jgi:hypothetical protein
VLSIFTYFCCTKVSPTMCLQSCDVCLLAALFEFPDLENTHKVFIRLLWRLTLGVCTEFFATLSD